jgi:glutamine amidotransferase
LIAIIDYGMGNLGSMANMLKRLGALAVVTSDASEIAAAEKLILPGVGAFDNGMRQLRERGLIEILRQQVLQAGKPVLGVCLGMQLLAERSEEGTCEGLGWIRGQAVRLKPSENGQHLKVPHMGWNIARAVTSDSLFQGLEEDSRFYFVHSFHLQCSRDVIVAETPYGMPFVSAIRSQNIAGVQFHPEKSHRFGMRLLQNFAENS